jgi:7-cyano-7-deazaguanine synthase in queuosine biosynthesis
MEALEPVVIHVAHPEVDGETVVFRWTQSEPNPYQVQNEFSFRYEAIDLARFNPILLLEIFLSMQLRVFAGYGRAVHVTLPFAIPAPVAEFWTAYNNADEVKIGPLSDDGSYEPWMWPEIQPDNAATAAIFFGGGKDSMAVACLASEVYGPEQVVLVQYVGPLKLGAAYAAKLANRQRKWMLEPANRELGLRTQRVFTDYQAIFRPEWKTLRPHLEYFTAGSLPVLLHYGVRVASFGCTWNYYGTGTHDDGSRFFRHGRSRPETLMAQTDHYRATLGRELVVTNAGTLVSPWSAITLLAERYPRALETFVSCTNVDTGVERWCNRCAKCFQAAMYLLATGRLFPDLDYERVLTESRDAKDLVAFAHLANNFFGCGDVSTAEPVCDIHSYHAVCSAINSGNIELLADRLRPKTKADLRMIRATYEGRWPTSGFETPRAVVPMLNIPEAEQFAGILNQHIPVVDTPRGQLYTLGKPAERPFLHPMPTRLDDLPHIKAFRRDRAAIAASVAPEIKALTPEGPQMLVTVAPPEIAGDKVTFRWTQSAPNPYQVQNEFFFRYEAIDLSQFSQTLFAEIFLGLQLRVFAAYDLPVHVVLPVPIPAPVADFWRTFHDADNVTIGPLSADDSYSPWVGAAPRARSATAAVFFGGGKDSTAATCLASEVYGAENVVAVQYVGPLKLGDSYAEKLARRQQTIMLEPAGRILKVQTQRAFTNYQAIFSREWLELRPHVEYFTLGALPVLLTYGVRVAVFGYSWAYYNVVKQADGSLYFYHHLSRPETLMAQTDHYRAALGTELVVTSINNLLGSLATTIMLAERYPQGLETMVSCTSLEKGVGRWCNRCWKCFQASIYTLASGKLFSDFDYDQLLSDAPYVSNVLDYAFSKQEFNAQGVIPWAKIIGDTHNYHGFCTAVATADFGMIPQRLSAKAKANVLMLQSFFGGHVFSSAYEVPRAVIPLLNIPEAEEMARIVGEHLRVVDELSDVVYAAGVVAEPAYRHRFPTRLDDLPHIRALRTPRRTA